MNPTINTLRMKDTFLSLLVAICTKSMRWLTVVHTFFGKIGNSPCIPQWCQLIAFYIAIPIFKGNNLCFQALYFIQCRRLVNLGFDKTIEGFSELLLHIGKSRGNLMADLRFYKGLKNIVCGFNTIDCTGDSCNRHSNSSPVDV